MYTRVRLCLVRHNDFPSSTSFKYLLNMFVTSLKDKKRENPFHLFPQATVRELKLALG